MPNKQEYLSVQGFNDIVYAWFQVNSEWSGKKGEPRYVLKKNASFTRIGEELDCTRQTASKRTKILISMGLLTEEDDRYLLTILPDDMSMLIEKETLRKMMSALNECTISIYVYLFSRFWANEKKSYEITLKQIKVVVGIGVSDSTNYRVKDILDILKKLGLIEYDLIKKQDLTGGIKSVYVIKQVKNKIG